MKQCWPEGDLRAFLDGELPAETADQISEHLETCAACGELCEQLSARAARVSSLMALLPEAGPVAIPAAPSSKVVAMPKPRRRDWLIPAFALAAALAVGFIVLPKHGEMPAPVAKVPAVVAPAPVTPSAAVEASSPVTAVADATPVRRPSLIHKASTQTPPMPAFVRLDDEPLETATLVRVSAENGQVKADLLVGPDGRAHAIRVLQ